MRMRREPADDLLHAPTADQNYNETRSYNLLDATASSSGATFGGWVRMGNRPNEHYAEMTVCLYLPDGRVGFMFERPHIEGHVAHDAGGLQFDVVEPYVEHQVTYVGDVCVLVNPREMADPGTAFKSNPHEECSIDLRLTAVSDPSGGEPIFDEAEEPAPGVAHSFATGHTEQQMAISGVLQVNGQRVDLDRYGDGRVVKVRDMQLTSEYDDEWFVHRSDVVLATDDHTYELHGEVGSSIPLRNRREGMVTRLTEGMTRWTCDDVEGAGLSEYLDQIVDDVPVGTTAGI